MKTPENYPEPLPSDLKDPLFEVIWQAIKDWDISRGRPEHLYSGPTGNDVMHILVPLRMAIAQSNADKGRLDWLESHLDKFDIQCSLSFSTPFLFTKPCPVIGDVIYHGQTLRLAIDSAMGKEQPQPLTCHRCHEPLKPEQAVHVVLCGACDKDDKENK